MCDNAAIITALCLCVGGIVAFPVLADETQPAQSKTETLSPSKTGFSPPSSEPPEKQYLLDDNSRTWLKDGLEELERFQVWLGGKVQKTGENIDDYFGTDEAFERSRDNRLDILTPVIIRDSGETEMTMKVRAKLALPKTEKRWQLLVTSEESSIKGEEGELGAEEADREKGNASVGFQVALEEYDKLASLLSFGVNLRGFEIPEPYVRLKKSYEWGEAAAWISRMSHELFWESEDGAGLDSKLVFDKRISPQHLLRAQTDGTWWHSDEYYDLTQRLLFYQELSVYRLLTYQLYGNWEIQRSTGERLTGYGTAINWRERAYKNWLFFEIQPEVGFSEEDNFKEVQLSLMLMLEMRFYQQ